MAVTRTHFRFRIDVWTANGESIVGHVAGIEDYELVHAVHGLAHEHVALLELNKSNRGFILAGSRVLSAVGACPLHDGVR